MLSAARRLMLATGAVIAAIGGSTHGAAADAEIERGKYLVAFGGCGDCHTRGYFFGHSDMTKFLGGSDVGFSIPGLGVFVGRNLTPDKETGIGKWTRKQIVTAITTGVRPDGRTLAPIMPSQDFSHLTKSDAYAIASYLKSLPPVNNAVPGPFGPNEAPTVFVMTIVPANVYASMPKPGGPPPEK